MYIQKYKYPSHPNRTVREQCDMQEGTEGSFACKRAEFRRLQVTLCGKDLAVLCAYKFNMKHLRGKTNH